MVFFEVAQRARHGLPRGANQLRHFFMGKRQFHTDYAIVYSAVGGPLQQQPRQLFRYRMRQADGTDHVVGRVTVARKVFRRAQARVAVLTQETEQNLRGE